VWFAYLAAWGDHVCRYARRAHLFLESAQQTAFEFSVPLRDSKPGEIWGICVLRDGVAYVIYQLTGDNQGLLLQSNFFSWDQFGSNDNVAKGVDLPTNQGPIYGFDIDRGADPNTLFAAMDTNVFVSRDEGGTWKLATKGLPRRPHCTELRAVAHDNGQRFLYLSTFRRSVWQAPLG